MEKSMKPKKRVSLPRYQQIAVEIAERVVEGRYKVGEKIHARSTLASNFNVSPETARKAINVLVDLEIMEVRHGSGAYVSSKENAQKFVEKYRNVQSVKEIQQEIADGIDRQRQELANFSELLEALVNQTKQVHDISPFIPYELKITEKALHLEKSIVELNIWQVTGATVVAIQTETELLLSPGPYAKLSIGNIVYFVGSELSFQRMENFFYPNE
ncbi:GntR family transcriptional regulator [Enterococcus saccharolyticus]|uniref:GntR family transcriptional regulator n=1 Tax=Enterococcus saccharolyticus subsp. saccharolyticus ATCC 43076 TaxID=1139996 RepID=S0JSX8_9ENTE|nr:GntR family transcriptional regulator [Enterococcus saccharolyticus]EOT30031.1 GntR family transcriptional regulator [Enterococcus saccharolyticus subsp. saccharolyticus ATCC 43076]EOT80577.1 GntR family transcriptional regulator [Enterococcus saccharolyticus subsp. saccharolyticus ATCC 43076]OJG90116.1 GntR family transcriptional regulator [Enterococcus saccharolyticus]